MAPKRYDIKATSCGLAGAFTSGGQYQAKAYETETGRDTGIYAYGSTKQDAIRAVVRKLRDRYGSDAQIMY